VVAHATASNPSLRPSIRKQGNNRENARNLAGGSPARLAQHTGITVFFPDSLPAGTGNLSHSITEKPPREQQSTAVDQDAEPGYSAPARKPSREVLVQGLEPIRIAPIAPIDVKQ
jgi:hypothetical protein